jgi:hypothetical protein
MPSSLPVSRLIRVSINLTPAGAQAQNLSSLLLLGTSAVLDSVERFRSYPSLDAVAQDFLTSSQEYMAAALWFQQAPQPTELKIGRWFAAAGSGVLRGAPLSAAEQAIDNFDAVASGGFTYTLNGGSATNVTGINLSTATNLNQVASLITAALTGAVMVWNANYSRFELTSSATGDTSAVSFLTAPGSGTDISTLLGMRSTSSGAYRAQGVAAEEAIDVVQMFNENYGQDWYAVVVPSADNADHLLISEYIEATDTKHLYGITTQEAGVLVAATTSDIAYQMKELDRDKTVVQYSSSNPYAIVSLLGRILTVDYTGNATTITLAYKDQPGITPESLNTVQADSVRSKCCNAFLRFNNDTAIILNGVVSSGNFVDEITGMDWLAIALQTALYNLLYTTPTKIPQTDAGTNMLVTTAEAVCDQAVVNGLLGPGVWQSAGFGTLVTGEFLPKGYFVWAQRMADQNPVDRAARRSPTIQIAAKLAGAIHEVSIAVSVNK